MSLPKINLKKSENMISSKLKGQLEKGNEMKNKLEGQAQGILSKGNDAKAKLEGQAQGILSKGNDAKAKLEGQAQNLLSKGNDAKAKLEGQAQNLLAQGNDAKAKLDEIIPKKINSKNLLGMISSSLGNIDPTKPKYVSDIANTIHSVGEGSITKVIVITILLVSGVISIVTDIITFNDMKYNILTFLLLNLFFLPILSDIMIAIFHKFSSINQLDEPLALLFSFLVSLMINYKLYKLYIVQKCAERKIECDYYDEIISQPMSYAFITTTALFALMILIAQGASIVDKVAIPYSPPQKWASGYLKVYTYSPYVKYGVIYNIIGIIVHFFMLLLIDSKLKTPPLTY